MGADISKEQADDFKAKYRERYGQDISQEQLLEEYRMAKLKADREQRQQSLGGEVRSRDEDFKRESKHGSRDDGDYYARKKQDDNLRIMKSTYEQSRRNDHSHRHDRSRRSEKHKEERRHDRDRRSSRHRDRSRHSSSDSSTKENRRKSNKPSKNIHPSEKGYDKSSSRKSRSVDEMNKNSTSRHRDDRHSSSKHRSRSSRYSSDSSSRENRRKENPSSSGRNKSENNREILSRKEHSSDKEKRSYRTSRKNKIESKTDDERLHSKKDDKKYDSEQSEVRKKKKKKKKKTKAHHQSAPDLLEADRQYGRGPWQRTHSYFNEYGQSPQSWVQQISQEQNATLPAPVMERQIIYGMPQSATLPRVVDGLGYPLKEKSPGFHPVPYQTYLMHKPTRPQSMDLSYVQHDFSSLPPSTVQSPNTSIKLPAGAVPAVGPSSHGITQASVPVLNSQPIIPQRGYEVQAHLPSNISSTLPSKFRHQTSGNASMPPTYKTPPQYGNSIPERSEGPTPKPRTKSPVKDGKVSSKEKSKSKKSKSSKHRTEPQKHKSKITATSAREELESMLAFDYDMMNVKSGGEFSEEFPPVFPGNYRANDTIFVDDVIFRKQPKIQDGTDSSDMMTDEEHVLTLGEEFSPNSVGYSSGFDLEIPEGFCFDSEDVETSSGINKKKQPVKQKSTIAILQKKRISSSDNKTKNNRHSKSKTSSTKQKDPMVLTTIDPVSRPRKHSSSPDRRNKGSPRNREIEGKRPVSSKSKRSTSNERVIHSSKAAMLYSTQAADYGKKSTSKDKVKKKNRRIQAPSKDESYQRIITPSHHRSSQPKPNQKKKTHDIGVGTKLSAKQKSIAIQTTKSKGPVAQPIYFLKPLSAQEVFIDDSSLASRSETDISTVHTAVASSVASTGSATARSGTSWSRSSTFSSNLDNTDPSEIESVVPRFERNSEFYSSKPNEQPSIASSVDFEPEHSSSIGPPSMTLGVSESIHASSYAGKGGKVFCITRSRHGSSPSSTIRDESRIGPPQVHLGPTTNQLKAKPQQQSTSLKSDSQVSESQYFNPLEVGQWVLNYVQEHKLAAQNKNPHVLKPMENPMMASLPSPNGHSQLKKQEAFDLGNRSKYSSQESNQTFESPTHLEQPNIVPLTTEALSMHEGSTLTTKWQRSEVEESGTELSTNVASDLGPFQRELIKARHKIRKYNQREKSPELSHNAEEYKAQLKQWNDSPTTNVVLAEVCAVTDDDIEKPKSRVNTRPFSNYSKDQVEPTHNSGVIPTSDHDQSEETESETETTSSTVSSDDHINPRERLISSLNNNQPAKYDPSHHQSHMKMNDDDNFARNAKNMEKIDNFLDNLDKNNASNIPTRSLPPVVSPSISDQDWRVVSAPAHPPIRKQQSGNKISQMDPTVPRPNMKNPLTDSNDSIIQKTKEFDPHLQPLRLRSTSSLTNDSESASCPSPISNPFNKMDSDEIESLVGKIPNRGSMDDIELEKDVIAQLEKSRQSTKRESLEERTARILGMHRRTSTDDSDDETLTKPPLSLNKKTDMNTYMNNLLTGVTDVSPASRQKYFASDMAGKNSNPEKSPLAVATPVKKDMLDDRKVAQIVDNIAPSKSLKESHKTNAESSSDDDVTQSESFSVNVSDSVMEANVDCKVRLENKDSEVTVSPTEYKIPDNVDGRASGPMSPSRGMMLSYGANIYAETPGFHKQTSSFDSTESDEPDLVPSMTNASGYHQNVGKRDDMIHRAQESPVPVAVNSPPLTDKEIDIVRELMTSTTNSVVGSAGDMSPVANGSTHGMKSLSLPSTPSSNRSWSPTRELAREKIAKSIGFTLPNQKSKTQHDSSHQVINSEEYDIKILSMDRKKNSENYPANEVMAIGNSQDSHKDVADALHSVGLKPEESWVLSV